MQPPAKTRRTVRYGVVDGGAWGERGRRMVGVAWQVTPVAGRSIVNKSQRQITYQQQFPTPRPVCYYSYRWSSPAATAATWPTCLVKVLAYQMQPWRGTPSPDMDSTRKWPKVLSVADISARKSTRLTENSRGWVARVWGAHWGRLCWGGCALPEEFF